MCDLKSSQNYQRHQVAGTGVLYKKLSYRLETGRQQRISL